eukprot:TRINITY_DN22192_c0_g1_i1.p1 TRINITY_DN22192_c0_g1~~TRINITY_DN22192_c0_g1_i1.p1  ORF type:complete len:561 (-),score=90.52 TRINITY_DN22192_c0_g1_i1:20-1657(-)
MLVMVDYGHGATVQEINALEDLYNATGGPKWSKNANWLVGDPCISNNKWNGISCVGTSVTDISLANLGLNGTLPVSIGDLTALTHINLGYNELSGTIPSQIGLLKQLTKLHLENNNFIDKFEDLIQKLIPLPVLQFLDVDTDKLIGGSIPTFIANLSSLKTLRVSWTNVSGTIPTQMGLLTGLIELFARSNKLTGTIPLELASLTSLTYLDLCYNTINGPIPTGLGALPNLQKLDLSFNRLMGTIPVAFSILPSLNFFNLSNNPSICDGCFRFSKPVTTCAASNIDQSCTCNYIPCGSSICPVDPSCFDQCSGRYSNIGICKGGTLVINSETLNSNSNQSLSNINSFINGTVTISQLEFSNSTSRIDGGIIGNNGLYYVHNSSLTVKGPVVGVNTLLEVYHSAVIINGTFNFTKCIIRVDGESSIFIQDDIQFLDTRIIFSYSQPLPVDQPIVLINSSHPINWPTLELEKPYTGCNSQQSREKSLSLQFTLSCSSLPSYFPALVGGLCGGVFLLAIVIAFVVIKKEQNRIAQQFEDLKKKTRSVR